MKLVINVCHGGFELSADAIDIINKKKNLEITDPDYITPYYEFRGKFPRYDLDLVETVESLGAKASGPMANLVVVEVEGPRFMLNEYDGWESIETPETTRWEIIDTQANRDEHPELFL